MQLEAAAAEVDPAGQFVQTVPPEVMYLPLAHCVHAGFDV
jgi:hypothetical protein